MENKVEHPSTLVLSYLALRRIVGGLGVLLPLFMVAGARWVGPDPEIRDSISSYYHSAMGDVFVGILFAIAVFLFSYQGYDSSKKERIELSDNAAGNLACVFALGVGLFPTAGPSEIASRLHLTSAALLFLTLAYISMKLFTKTKKKGEESEEKLKRNKVYVICGVVMLVSIALIVVFSLWFEGATIAEVKPVFWLESLALLAFGVSWFIKGETLLKDAPE